MKKMVRYPWVYHRYKNISVLFESLDHFNNFPNFLNKRHPGMEKLPLLDLEVSHEGNKFVSTVY